MENTNNVTAHIPICRGNGPMNEDLRDAALATLTEAPRFQSGSPREGEGQMRLGPDPQRAEETPPPSLLRGSGDGRFGRIPLPDRVQLGEEPVPSAASGS